MPNTQVSDELRQRGVKFTLLSKDSPEIFDLQANFEKMVKINKVAEIDWSTAEKVSSFTSDQYSDLFDLAENHISDVFSGELVRSEICVIPFDSNAPTIVLHVDEAIKSIDILLELEPLWIVSFSKNWCFEWRRSSYITSGFFT